MAIERSPFACLDDRMIAAQTDPAAAPHDAWRRLRAAEGPRTTIIDLYELVARRRGGAAHELPLAEIAYTDAKSAVILDLLAAADLGRRTGMAGRRIMTAGVTHWRVPA